MVLTGMINRSAITIVGYAKTDKEEEWGKEWNEGEGKKKKKKKKERIKGKPKQFGETTVFDP